MAEAVTTAVEPVAPAATPAEPAPVLQPTDPKARHEWRLKGPQGPPKEPEAAPAAGAVEKPQGRKRLTLDEREAQVAERTAKARLTLEERQAKLREDIKIQREVERQVQALDRTSPPAAPAPPAPAETRKSAWDRLKNHPEAPKLDQFENYEDFSAELSVFVAEKIADEREAAREKAAKQSQREQATAARLKTFGERYAAADQETRDLIEASDLFVPDDPRHPVTYAITDSEVAPQMMRYLVEHPDEHARILNLPDPNAQYVAMQRIEATILALRPPAASAPVKPAPRVADSRPASPAPEEPVVLGRRPGSPVDELKAAWERGDTRTARRLQLERDRGSVTTR